MKPPLDKDPRRWKELSPDGGGPEAEIGAAARLIRPASPPDATRLARISRRIAEDLAARPSPPAGRPAWIRTAALVGTFLLLGGVAMAVSGKLIQRMKKQSSAPVGWNIFSSSRRAGISSLTPAQLRTPARRQPAPEPAPSTPSSDGARISAPSPAAPGSAGLFQARIPRAKHELALVETPRTVTGSAASSRLPETRPRLASSRPAGSAPRMGLLEPPALVPAEILAGRAAGSVTPTVSPRVGQPSPQVRISEAEILARALGRLRRDHDPLWALGDLDEHDRQYPRGELRRETALARAEALLALDRNSEALDVLDALRLGPSELDRRALLARAELRAHEGRRAEAIADFDRVLQGPVDPNTAIDQASQASQASQIAERALYGRAVCRLRGGDLGGARVDLRAYLERFPRGPHAGDVEKTLGRLGS